MKAEAEGSRESEKSATLEKPQAPEDEQPSSDAPESTALECGVEGSAPSEKGKSPEVGDSEQARSPSGGERWRYVAWAGGTLVALGAFIWLLTAVQTVSVPFLVAFILAYLLDPLIDRFEARGISRTLAICIILSLGLVATAGLVLLVGPQLVEELSAVPEKLRVLAAQILPWVEGRFGWNMPTTVEDALSAAHEWLGGIEMSAMTRPASDVARAVMGGTSSLLTTVVGILMVPVFTFFLLRDFDNIVEQVRDLLPTRYRPQVIARVKEIDHAMSGFIRGQLSVAGILAVLYTARLWAVGLPMALLVGILSGLGNMVPYLGTTVGVVLATLMAVLDWQGFGHLLMVYGVFVIVQLLEGWVVTPRIVGESVGLSPFVVIVAVLLFGELFGFVGILIAVPLAAILKILLRVVLEHYRASPLFRT